MMLSTEEILYAVRMRLGVSRDEMSGPMRNPRFVAARWAAMYLLRTHREMSFPEITRAIYGDDRSHSGVISGLKRARRVLNDGPRLDHERKFVDALREIQADLGINHK